MSRLESFILRLKAQRNCLNAAAALIADLEGPVLELGLGNGRTYDHLRELFPTREIFVFERQPAPHPACMPDPAHLIVGELEETLPNARSFLPMPAALVHSDIGSHDLARDARLAAWLATVLPGITRPGAVVASDRALSGPDLLAQPLPGGSPGANFFFYRRAA
jgi:hypothetical protein